MPPIAFDAEGQFAQLWNGEIGEQFTGSTNFPFRFPGQDGAPVGNGGAGVQRDHKFRRVREKPESPILGVEAHQMIAIAVPVAIPATRRRKRRSTWR